MLKWKETRPIFYEDGNNAIELHGSSLAEFYEELKAHAVELDDENYDKVYAELEGHFEGFLQAALTGKAPPFGKGQLAEVLKNDGASARA